MKKIPRRRRLEKNKVQRWLSVFFLGISTLGRSLSIDCHPSVSLSYGLATRKIFGAFFFSCLFEIVGLLKAFLVSTLVSFGNEIRNFQVRCYFSQEFFTYLFSSLHLSFLAWICTAIFTVWARIKQRNTSGGCSQSSQPYLHDEEFFVWFYGWPIYEREPIKERLAPKKDCQFH